MMRQLLRRTERDSERAHDHPRPVPTRNESRFLFLKAAGVGALGLAGAKALSGIGSARAVGTERTQSVMSDQAWTGRSLVANYLTLGDELDTTDDFVNKGTTRLEKYVKMKEGPLFDVKAYGALGNGSNDDTSAIQAAIDAAAKGDSSGNARTDAGVVWFPHGLYRVTQLNLRPGVVLRGVGIGSISGTPTKASTCIQQISTAACDMIIFTPWADSASSVGPVEIHDMRLQGHSGNTVGNGICFKDSDGNPLRIQDHVVIENVLLIGFAENGIYAPYGAGPLFMRNVAARQCGGFGFYLKGYPDDSDMPGGSGAPTAPSFTMLSLGDFSADGCIEGMLKIKNVKGSVHTGAIHLYGLKSECAEVTILNASLNKASASIGSQADVPQRYAVVLEDVNFPVTIDGLAVLSNSSTNGWAPSDAIRILGTASPLISYRGVAVRKLSDQSGTINLINDVVAGVSILYAGNPHGVYAARPKLEIIAGTETSDGLVLMGAAAGGGAPRLFFYNKATGAGRAIRMDTSGNLLFTFGANPGSASGTTGMLMDTTGNIRPGAHNTYNSGSDTVRWKKLYSVDVHAAGLMELDAIADPTAPAASKGRLYLKNDGAGKMQLVARFPTGAVQVIATEP